ncbi:MAG TPA: ABC transporter permease subunit [Bacillota bacterium]
MLSLNRSVFLKELRENRWKAVAFAAVLVASAAANVFAYNYLQSMFQSAGQTVPDFFKNQINAMMGSYSTYVWSSWFGKSLYQMSTLFLILLGMSTMASEVSRGTASYLLTKPVSRGTVLFSKWLAQAAIFVTMIIAGTALLYPMSLAIGQTYDFGLHLASLPLALSSGLVVLTLAVVASVGFDDPVKAGGASAIFLIALSVLGFFKTTQRWSLFYYFSAAPVAVSGGDPQWLHVLVMLAITAAVYLVGARLLERKDF